jgi:hypothetical protein
MPAALQHQLHPILLHPALKQTHPMNVRKTQTAFRPLPLAVGLLLPMVVFMGWKGFVAPRDQKLATIAQENGWNVRDYTDVMLAMKGLTERPDLTNQEWTRVRSLLYAGELPVRLEAITVASLLTESSHRNEAVLDVQALLQDPDPRIRREALMAVYKLRPEGWVQTLRHALQDSDEEVRDRARSLLERSRQ